MLVTFKSKASGNLLMFEENARQILDLFGKDTRQGIITSAETGGAIKILEEEIARKKIEETQEKEEREKEEQLEKENEDRAPFRDKPKKSEMPIPFSTRAYPFLQMLHAAHKKECDIVWGV
ncbi:MAG: DUF1840 domain-containing protein [Betaproteobacteria bacterium]|nr:DUF1840 domain-containing protein [Betaproteobacteria bacterium]